MSIKILSAILLLPCLLFFNKPLFASDQETANPIQDVVNSVASFTEKAIDEQAQICKEEKIKSYKKCDEALTDASKTISSRLARHQFILENMSETEECKKNMDAILDAKFKSGKYIEKIENTWRKKYILANENQENFIITYEAILDLLAHDGYIATAEAADRKSRICKEWPEARIAYGRESNKGDDSGGNGNLTDKLKTLNKLLADRVITKSDFEQQKKKLLDSYTEKKN
jgi:hypothetical protein